MTHKLDSSSGNARRARPFASRARGAAVSSVADTLACVAPSSRSRRSRVATWRARSAPGCCAIAVRSSFRRTCAAGSFGVCISALCAASSCCRRTCDADKRASSSRASKSRRAPSSTSDSSTRASRTRSSRYSSTSKRWSELSLFHSLTYRSVLR